MEAYLGLIVGFAGNFNPRGWMLCNGQILAIAQNTALFSILGTTYGGNGVTTFALPDLRGTVAISQGQAPGRGNYALGETGGTENATLNVNQMPMHTHVAATVVNASARADSESPAGAVPAPFTGTNVYASAPDGSTTMNGGMVAVTNQPAGGSQPFSILQPFLAIHYIICVEGLFPSRN